MDLMTDWNTYKETEEAQRVIELFEEGSLNDILHTFVKEGAAEFRLFEHTIKNVFEYSLIPYDVPIKDLFLYGKYRSWCAMEKSGIFFQYVFKTADFKIL